MFFYEMEHLIAFGLVEVTCPLKEDFCHQVVNTVGGQPYGAYRATWWAYTFIVDMVELSGPFSNLALPDIIDPRLY
jgi:hypothetical protein